MVTRPVFTVAEQRRQQLQLIANIAAPGTVVGDPEAFERYINEEVVREQQGQRSGFLRSFFDKTVGRAAGAVGRGALGVGRFTAEGFEPVTRSFTSPVTDNPEAVQRILNEPRVNQAATGLQAIGDTGAGAVAESIAPAVSGETLGVGPNAFDSFLTNLAQQRQGQSVVDALTLQATRDAYQQTQFNPVQRLALEAAGDPTNLIPGAAAARGLRLAGRVAPRAAGEGIQSIVQTGARQVPNALERGTLAAERSAVRQAANARPVVPFGPNRTTEGIPGGIPAGAADDVDPFDTELFPLPSENAQPLNRPRSTNLTPQAAADITREAQFRAEVGPNPRATIEQGLADPVSVPDEKLRIATVEVASPDGGPPPRTPDAPPTRPVEPSDFLDRAIESRRQGTGWKWNSLERTDQALLRLHDAALNVETRRARDVVAQGNDRLAAFNWGRKVRGTRAPQSEDDIFAADEMYRALHGEIEPPPGMREVYDDLRAQMDFESAQRIDFDPEMATVEDYFYRGWKPPENVRVSGRGQLVFTPGFKKPRTDATYSEMRAAGFEPLFWNPYEQWNVARMQGVRYRQQMELVEALKNSGDDVILPHTGGTVPEGWRVPKIGPAFEGKPIMIRDELTGEVTPGAVRQWIVPDRIANALESAYGKKPSLGTVSIGNRDVQIQKLIDWAVFTPKRAKLLGSVFQQIDFATRAGIGTAANMVDHILRGRPDLAVRDGLKYPPAVFDLLRANFSPSRRTALRRTLDSTEPIVQGRRGVTMRSLLEQGLSVRDSSLIPQDVDRIVREAANGAGVLGHRHVTEGLASLEKAMRDGLFEGVYPAAIIYDAKNVTGPMMQRLYGKNLTDAQLSARIAAVLNTKYSTIPETMSVVQNRFLRETMRRFFFSVNEQEGLLRQAAGPFRGADKGYWLRHWIGAAIFFLGVANAIHYASTGEPLPKERYIPLSKRGYNTRFASPDLPVNVGRSGLPATLDIVGQMDTAFRVLDPKGYIESRFSVPVSAAATQWSGENYFGDRVDELGPGGVVSRTVALGTDLFGPIGAAPLAGSALREVAPQTARAVPAGESRLGIGGSVLQATGLNLRAYNFDELQKLKESNPQMAPQVDRELTVRKIDDAVRHANDPTHILGTTNNLRARLREAQRLGYTSAEVILERAVRRREERQREQTQERARESGGNVIVVPVR